VIQPGHFKKLDPAGHGLALTQTVRAELFAALMIVAVVAAFALWRQFRHHRIFRRLRWPRWFLDFTRTDTAMWIAIGCFVVAGIILFIANIAMFWSTDLN
jgi:hypothetical protein